MSTDRSGPIWVQPAPGARRPRYTRQQIAEIAIRIADAEGFEALSMRRIADELGAGTMTLYHYVRTKEDLIELMDDAIMAEVLVPPSALTGDWKASIKAIAHASYRVFRAHPWSLHALAGARFGPNSMRHVEQSMTAVDRAPFDIQTRLDLIGIVDDYVFGHVYRNLELDRHDSLAGGEPSADLVTFTRAQLATRQYPMLEKLVGDDLEGAWRRIARDMNQDGRFERGLDALIDGLERTLPRAKPAKPAKRRPR